MLAQPTAEDSTRITLQSTSGARTAARLATAWRVGKALQHGTVNVNETSNYWDQLAPFGVPGPQGRDQSEVAGVGRSPRLPVPRRP